MTLKEWRNKYILYDKTGKVVIITRDKKIINAYMRNYDGKTNS